MHVIDIPRFEHAQADVRVDGVIDEAIWKQVPIHGHMRVFISATGEAAELPTHIRMFATEKGL